MTTDAWRAREDLSAGCLDLVRRQLAALGMDMTHCPPLMYDDAIHSLATRLGRLAGLTTVAELVAAVQEAGSPESWDRALGGFIAQRLDRESVQRCPVCNGQGTVSRPPHIAGDQPTWVSTTVAPYRCRRCAGLGTIEVPPSPHGREW